MSDFYQDLRGLYTADAAARRNGSSPTAWPAPLEQPAYYGLPGRVVNTISPHSEADPAGLLTQFLVAYANVCGRHAYYAVESDRHYANEYVVQAGESSKARKGTSWGRVRDVMTGVDAEWVADKTGGGLSSGEGLIQEVEDPMFQRVKEMDGAGAKKRWTGRWIDEQVSEGVTDKRLLIQESELSRCFAVMRREGSTLSAILRALWDNGDAAVRTRTTRTRCTGAHVSIIGHVPIDEVRMELTRTQASNGFANRFLWIAVRRARVLPFGGGLAAGELLELQADTADCVRRAQTLTQASFTPDARELWASAYEQLSEGRAGMLGSILARAEAHVARLALIYALTDAASTITVEHLQAALALWRYAEASAAYIWGDAIGDPVADDILRELRLRKDGMTRSEIRELLGGSYNADRIQAALEVLRRHRLAWMVKELGGQGRPAERWHAQTKTQEPVA